MIIIGAGMAGLLAAGMLRTRVDALYEKQDSLPNNHSAVLRFRSTAVADALGIEFKQVPAIKAIQEWRNPIADALAYSRKTNGTATLRSILTATSGPVTRFIAPPDLIEQMAARVSAPIFFGKSELPEGPAISTMPMPDLMELLGWPGERPEFKSVPGCNLVVQLRDVDAYCSLYIPAPHYPFARISITGSQMVAESYLLEKGDIESAERFQSKVAEDCCSMMGLTTEHVKSIEIKQQKYAKILPIDESVRREFIIWASEQHNVYSLGRYATWRPGLLLDDAVNDVRVIQRLIINRGEAYPHKLRGMV